MVVVVVVVVVVFVVVVVVVVVGVYCFLTIIIDEHGRCVSLLFSK